MKIRIDMNAPGRLIGWGIFSVIASLGLLALALLVPMAQEAFFVVMLLYIMVVSLGYLVCSGPSDLPRHTTDAPPPAPMPGDQWVAVYKIGRQLPKDGLVQMTYSEAVHQASQSGAIGIRNLENGQYISLSKKK